MTTLGPIKADPRSWGQGINRRGDVLGYSWGAGPERIGVWRHETFQAYFVEGTPEFPTISSTLLWNRKGLIVITNCNDLNSYLVPEPNVRIKVTDQAGDLPAWTWVKGINARGDLIGSAGAVPTQSTWISCSSGSTRHDLTDTFLSGSRAIHV